MNIEISITINGNPVLTNTLHIQEEKLPDLVLPLTIKGMLADLSKVNFYVEKEPATGNVVRLIPKIKK